MLCANQEHTTKARQPTQQDWPFLLGLAVQWPFRVGRALPGYDEPPPVMRRKHLQVSWLPHTTSLRLLFTLSIDLSDFRKMLWHIVAFSFGFVSWQSPELVDEDTSHMLSMRVLLHLCPSAPLQSVATLMKRAQRVKRAKRVEAAL